MMRTAEQLKRAWQDNPDLLAHAFGETLRDFGYSSLTDQYVKEEIARLLAGGNFKGGPSAFIAGWLKDGID